MHYVEDEYMSGHFMHKICYLGILILNVCTMSNVTEVGSRFLCSSFSLGPSVGILHLYC